MENNTARLLSSVGSSCNKTRVSNKTTRNDGNQNKISLMHFMTYILWEEQVVLKWQWTKTLLETFNKAAPAERAGPSAA